MKDLFQDLDRLRWSGHRLALARVVRVDGSGPRDPGAVLLVGDDGAVCGSVSGGCVEGAVVGECQEVLDGGPARLVTYGVADEDSYAAGLTCGGTIHVFMSAMDWWTQYDELRAVVDRDEGALLATVVEGPGSGKTLLLRPDGTFAGSLGDKHLNAAVVRDGLGQLASGTSRTGHYGAAGRADLAEVTVFLESFAPPPRMLIFGAVDFAAALARVAKVMGHHVIVCDPRATFATKRRFPMADEVLAEWPHKYLRSDRAPRLTARDAVCVLTHDHKVDVPALVEALRTDAGYIGAMGSRRTTSQRNARLREAGVDDERLSDIYAPIGLDLGARTPEETAIAICAELIRVRTGRSGDSLASGAASIHGRSESFAAEPNHASHLGGRDEHTSRS